MNHQISQANPSTCGGIEPLKLAFSSIIDKKNQANLTNAIHLQLKKINKKKSLQFDYGEWQTC